MSELHEPTETRPVALVSLRAASPDDFDFALALYLESAIPLLAALGRWDEARIVGRFRRNFRPAHAHVIRAGDSDIGWMQVSPSDTELHLDQLHLVARFRNRGIGARLLEALLERAKREGRTVALNVMRGNPAISLYRRLGFRAIGGDKEKIRMRWGAHPGKRG